MSHLIRHFVPDHDWCGKWQGQCEFLTKVKSKRVSGSEWANHTRKSSNWDYNVFRSTLLFKSILCTISDFSLQKQQTSTYMTYLASGNQGDCITSFWKTLIRSISWVKYKLCTQNTILTGITTGGGQKKVAPHQKWLTRVIMVINKESVSGSCVLFLHV